MRLPLLLALLLVGFSDIAVRGDTRSRSDESAMTAVTSFNELQNLAEAMAQRDFVPRRPLPKTLEDLEYEQYREILFKHDKAVWGNTKTPFWIETFHRGFVQRDRVLLFAIEADKTREIPFSIDNFHYGVPIAEDDSLADAGHAGIRIVGQFPEAEDVQEILTFLGSSYFRGRSAATVYGASARGLAVNIGLPREEEFPFFKAFWVPQADPTDKRQTVLALLDSRSVSGAYRFELEPGSVETRIKVQGKLFFREVPEKIGIAPLTSMWIWGDGLDGPPLDKRPAVHDSDGLLVCDGKGAWTWRAFARQAYPSVAKIPADGVSGFGLIQRNCEHDHFADSNALYHKRPSLWVVPKHALKAGSIELIELPGAHEGIDNIGAYWVPNELPQVGEPMDIEYTLRIFPGDVPEQVAVARATKFSVQRQQDQIDIKIHFTPAAATDTPRPITVDSLIVDASLVRGELISKTAEQSSSGDWIVSISMHPTEQSPVELGVTLMHGGKKISERFTYLCPDQTPTFMYPQVYTRKE